MLYLGVNPCVSGLNYHDPSLALVSGRQVMFAAEEERFNRIKNSPGQFPRLSMEYVLEHHVKTEAYQVVIPFCPRERSRRTGTELRSELIRTGLYETITSSSTQDAPIQNVSSVLNSSAQVLLGYEQIYRMWGRPNAIRSLILREMHGLPAPLDIHFIEHHLAHAAGAFLQSPFDDAVVVVVDGVGELAATSVWNCDDSGFKCLAKNDFPNSLGYFYAAVTAFLGFTPWREEGKTMALAPYGNARAMISTLRHRLCATNRVNFSELVQRCTGSGLSLEIEKAKLEVSKLFDVDPRQPSDEISQVYKDIAAATQTVLEQELMVIVDEALLLSKRSNVCVSGGVFYNCKANGEIRRRLEGKGFFVQPTCGDAGTALGAALYKNWSDGGQRPAPVRSLAYGRQFTDAAVRQKCAEWNLHVKDLEVCVSELAQNLADGNFLLWFDGAAEFGPRALGQRSILADPRDPLIAARLNAALKLREPWRPFGPMIAMEYASEILEGVDPRTPPFFMVEAYRLRPEWVTRIPGVIHSADQTVRPQLIEEKTLPRLHNLLSEFRALTGVPVLLNTSMNGRGQPLIDDIADAVKLLYTSVADVLVLNNLVLRKGVA